MKRIVCLVAMICCCCLLAAGARAEMPNYDVDAHCKEIASLGGESSQLMLNACYKQEQAAYDQLKPTWDQLPAAMRAHCDRIASLGGGGSFLMLNACVDQEQQAAQQNGSFKFKR